jgi:DNA-binding NtrC family response regulator
LKSSILIISDDQEVRRDLEQFFKNRNFQISFEIMNAGALLKSFDHSVDFMMVDVDSNIATSLDFISVVRESRPQLPVIVLSEKITPDQMKKYLKKGIKYFAMKPVQQTEFEELVKAFQQLSK